MAGITFKGVTKQFHTRLFFTSFEPDAVKIAEFGADDVGVAAAVVYVPAGAVWP